MAMNPLPILALGAAALILGGNKKKSSSGSSSGTSGGGTGGGGTSGGGTSGGGTSSSSGKKVDGYTKSQWKSIQEVLKSFSEIKYANNVKLCPECNPGKVDGVPGKNTRSAIRAFQKTAGTPVNGKWSDVEVIAYESIVSAIAEGSPIPCLPGNDYPSHLECKLEGDTVGLVPKGESVNIGAVNSAGSPSGADRVGSEDVIVTDSGCNNVLHVSQKFYRIQRDKVIRYAMDEMFQREHARNITDEMFEEYLPWCTILGPDGFGPGLKNFYDRNIDTVYADLSAYKNFPDRISKDAAERGIE